MATTHAQRVCTLYRRALINIRDWAVDRDLFLKHGLALQVRERGRAPLCLCLCLSLSAFSFIYISTPLACRLELSSKGNRMARPGGKILMQSRQTRQAVKRTTNGSCTERRRHKVQELVKPCRKDSTLKLGQLCNLECHTVPREERAQQFEAVARDKSGSILTEQLRV